MSAPHDQLRQKLTQMPPNNRQPSFRQLQSPPSPTSPIHSSPYRVSPPQQPPTMHALPVIPSSSIGQYSTGNTHLQRSSRRASADIRNDRNGSGASDKNKTTNWRPRHVASKDFFGTSVVTNGSFRMTSRPNWQSPPIDTGGSGIGSGSAGSHGETWTQESNNSRGSGSHGQEFNLRRHHSMISRDESYDSSRYISACDSNQSSSRNNHRREAAQDDQPGIPKDEDSVLQDLRAQVSTSDSDITRYLLESMGVSSTSFMKKTNGGIDNAHSLSLRPSVLQDVRGPVPTHDILERDLSFKSNSCGSDINSTCKDVELRGHIGSGGGLTKENSRSFFRSASQQIHSKQTLPRQSFQCIFKETAKPPPPPKNLDFFIDADRSSISCPKPSLGFLMYSSPLFVTPESYENGRTSARASTKTKNAPPSLLDEEDEAAHKRKSTITHQSKNIPPSDYLQSVHQLHSLLRATNSSTNDIQLIPL